MAPESNCKLLSGTESNDVWYTPQVLSINGQVRCNLFRKKQQVFKNVTSVGVCYSKSRETGHNRVIGLSDWDSKTPLALCPEDHCDIEFPGQWHAQAEGKWGVLKTLLMAENCSPSPTVRCGRGHKVACKLKGSILKLVYVRINN